MAGEGQVGQYGWEYRGRRPEWTVLYEAVRENLATLLEEASDVGRGLPRYVERDFTRYLECGVWAPGFARGRYESCQRAHVTAGHLVERVLPHEPYRQWTLSFPHRVRWGVARGWRATWVRLKPAEPEAR